VNNPRNNLMLEDGVSWQKLFSVTAGYDDLDVLLLKSESGTIRVFGWYIGTGAITEANYINFPKGTVIIDTQDSTIKLKTAAAGTDTWTEQAIAT
jgi:hypothetical protein